MRFLLSLLSLVFLVIVAGCGSEEQNYTDRMAEEHEGDSPVKNGSAAFEQEQPVQTQTVNCAQTDSGAMEGYLATPQNADKNGPGIIVIHEWWGLNDKVRMMTERLAGLGYTAFAVDLYNGKVAESPKGARQYMQIAQSNPQGALDNLNQVYSYLTDQQNAKQLGTIGWCFGGGWSLRTALTMPDKIDVRLFI